MNATRVRLLENCLANFEARAKETTPLDYFMYKYIKVNRLTGSGDRIFLCHQTAELMRWKGLIDFLTPPPVTWAGGVLIRPTGNCLHTLYKFLTNKGVPVEKCASSPIGLQLTVEQKLLDLPEYHEGLFEIQDEASQLAAARVACSPGQLVLDFCAGKGGKACVFGVFLRGKGRLILHDVRPRVLELARKQVNQAAIPNVTCMSPDQLQKAKLKGKADWVVCDVPCSSTGAFKRAPELKWQFNIDKVEAMCAKQREIVADAVQYMNPKRGKIVYITRSILNAENDEQVRYFCNTFNLQLVEEPLRSLPLSRGTPARQLTSENNKKQSNKKSLSLDEEGTILAKTFNRSVEEKQSKTETQRKNNQTGNYQDSFGIIKDSVDKRVSEKNKAICHPCTDDVFSPSKSPRLLASRREQSAKNFQEHEVEAQSPQKQQEEPAVNYPSLHQEEEKEAADTKHQPPPLIIDDIDFF